MKDRETLDEAIDRVAAQMSADGSSRGIELPVLPPRGFMAGWGSWRWAVVAAGVLFLATALVVLGPDRRKAEVVVETARNVQPSARDLGRPEGRPLRREEGRPLRRGANPAPRSGEDSPMVSVSPNEADVETVVPKQVSAPATLARAVARPARMEREQPEPTDVGDWGLQSLEAPATLDVAPVEVPALDVAETQHIEPLSVSELVIDTSSESPFTRE